jgi:hypothetical protein
MLNLNINASVSVTSGMVLPMFPFWLLVAFIFTVLPIALLIGHSVGRSTKLKKKSSERETAQISGEATMGATLTLLTLLIAFTFGFALTWADARKHAITEEAATIGSAFASADLLGEPGRSSLRLALLDYARTRYLPEGADATQADLDKFLTNTTTAKNALWPVTIQALRKETPPEIQLFVVRSLYDVLDSNTRRKSAISGSVPFIIKLMMLAAAIGAMVIVGYNLGLQGHLLTWPTFFFSVMLSATMTVVVDLERARHGLIVTSNDAILTTIFELEEAMGKVDR